MARYEIFPAPAGAGLLLDLQTDLLDGLTTRVVAPLVPLGTAPLAATLLNPVFEIDGAPYVLMTQLLSAVPVAILRSPIGNLSDQTDRITRAVDMVFQGF